MSNATDHDGSSHSDNTDTNLTTTYTQIASCAVDPEFTERRRRGLRAKLERERFELEQGRQKSFANTFRNLFGLVRNQG
ncbi:hypothetical protein N8198_04070 [Gammaproteobacteria bacterium]|nr:hypothetical protein [Gammaproteobacteria bacterium]